MTDNLRGSHEIDVPQTLHVNRKSRVVRYFCTSSSFLPMTPDPVTRVVCTSLAVDTRTSRTLRPWKEKKGPPPTVLRDKRPVVVFWTRDSGDIYRRPNKEGDDKTVEISASNGVFGGPMSRPTVEETTFHLLLLTVPEGNGDVGNLEGSCVNGPYV